MSSINTVTLVGRLTKELTLNETSGGKPVTNMILACKRHGAKPDQSGKVPSDFPSVVIWGELAKHSCKYLAQGDLAGVVGRVQTRTYEDAEGKTQYVTEIVAEQVQFLAKSKKNLEAASNSSNHYEQHDNNQFQRENNNTDSGWGWSSSSNYDDAPPY
ncbi:single-stranded DNA-binding protein (plasmid) [Sutcliffiella horikoshii]|uniref:single-stranded DNA-binding protein n=1 Tax=Sutcliffiella horikoshii TaxID=79883 RepID=UPI001CBB35E6|nr:single-stranded DNA-binding protein [Sutcliffiella horikoshii]UAL49872.1 single-stranded DNA-binding protein [Sutcliffiella horikoshii]